MPGLEDWHDIRADSKGDTVKHFAGAVCSHWTTENKTGTTRVSLDFRLIPGPLFNALKCGGAEPKGQLDVYRMKDGFYSCARRRGRGSTGSVAIPTDGGGDANNADGGGGGGGSDGGGDDEEEYQEVVDEWEREGPLLPPDARVGFPFTVNRWDKFTQKQAKERAKQAQEQRGRHGDSGGGGRVGDA
jgi:hypothetical protein